MRGFGLLLMVIALAGCEPEPDSERHAFFALGTLVEISIYDPPEHSRQAIRELESKLLRLEQRWRAWDEGGLAKINERLAAGETVLLDDEYLAGIARARAVSERSGGRFNPAMGRLVEAWGFHREDRGEEPPPDALTLTPLLPPPTLEALVIDASGRAHTEDSRLWLDMGAFAKGLAVAAGAKVLRKHGIANAIINAGGDLKVLGRHGARQWQIGIRHPRGETILAALSAAEGESVFTSGDYERFFVWQEERYHHVLDPATGLPASGVRSVTVVHDDPALADAAATALFVAGKAQWAAVARAMEIESAMLVLEDGSVELTPAMLQRLTFESEPTRVETVEP